jgi:hypothetical protein
MMTLSGLVPPHATIASNDVNDQDNALAFMTSSFVINERLFLSMPIEISRLQEISGAAEKGRQTETPRLSRN